MNNRLEKRIKKLEDESKIKSKKMYSPIFLKIGRRDKYPEGYVPDPPDREKCKKYGQKNIEAVKKQRIAIATGHEIIKWAIEIVA